MFCTIRRNIKTDFRSKQQRPKRKRESPSKLDSPSNQRSKKFCTIRRNTKTESQLHEPKPNSKQSQKGRIKFLGNRITVTKKKKRQDQ